MSSEKKIILEAKYFCFSYTFFHKTKLSKSYNCREAVRDSYNCREAVYDSYNCREAVRDSYNCPEAAHDSSLFKRKIILKIIGERYLDVTFGPP